MSQSINSKKTMLNELLGTKYPIIMAPMFLVSNPEMIIAAGKSGISGAIPAHNYRSVDEFRQVLAMLKKDCPAPFGVNLIVNKSNFFYKEQLKACCDLQVDYIITSLGSPEETIVAAHKKGIKVFCDVVDSGYAKKVESLGADAVIAVNNKAGGHAGPKPAKELIEELNSTCNIPVISAGGVGNKKQYQEILSYGAAGLSIGTIFIASNECPVSDEYKEACIQYGAKDIVMTSKLSGTPCSVIKTPYVEKIGTEQNTLEKLLNKNRQLKKWVKAFTFYKGMKKLQKAAFSATYQTVWCAGPSIEEVKSIRPISQIVEELVNGK
ncbi:MAG: nitronate monooxygenase [Flavobacteriales bacterium]|nr:nitronate monooxygenase [Flavobacteriales bacterium]